ncbi:thiol peroxidase [Myxococcus sp. AM001]|uniref:thiol peroxidase n=1 Tax=Myxococcus TaxID=32 RepID=UPI0013D8DBD6|nr:MULTISPECIES: thiol peroxidase [Myxococcus]NVJ07555.1 thiol peroxidase [Myxococcus sp. AM001]WIG93155.1 thiol peroxidase [Myxococcus sp. SDU36]
MAEHKGIVTFKGQPVTLVGDEVKVGDAAPDFTVFKGLNDAVRLSDVKGSVVVVSVAPSVDTRVCAAQLRAFNKEATALGPDVKVWFVTLDLPFALGRFIGAEGIQNVTTLSDYKDREFGEKYGVYMKELGLLARSTFVVDRAGKVVFREIVREMTHEPDYDGAMKAVREAL